MLVYAVTIFLSAFLLFQIQPLIAKFILPWFGGSAAVWSAALLFFQLVLLAGYTYAHFLIRYLNPKQQLKVHLPLLLLAIATLADHPLRALEARWGRRCDLPDPFIAGRHHRIAVHDFVRYQPAAASLVCANP
ncbi:MAG: hypothetical protein WDO18_06955 [Acidobacteriota bacterium]